LPDRIGASLEQMLVAAEEIVAYAEYS